MSIERNEEIALKTTDDAKTPGWLVRHGETFHSAAIRIFHAIIAATTPDWSPVLVEHEGRFFVEEASEDCFLRDAGGDAAGFDFHRHPGAIA